MRTKNFIATLFVLPILIWAGTGCGSSLTGSYTLTETQVGGLVSSACLSTQVVMNLVQSGTNINGNAVNTCFSQTLTGAVNGNILTSAVLTMNPLVQNTGSSVAQSCIYTGSLNIINNQITGPLTLQQQTSTSTTSYYGYCSSVVSITGTLMH